MLFPMTLSQICDSGGPPPPLSKALLHDGSSSRAGCWVAWAGQSQLTRVSHSGCGGVRPAWAAAAGGRLPAQQQDRGSLHEGGQELPAGRRAEPQGPGPGAAGGERVSAEQGPWRTAPDPAPAGSARAPASQNSRHSPFCSPDPPDSFPLQGLCTCCTFYLLHTAGLHG